MLPDALIYIFTVVGVACLGNLFLLSREYREKAKGFAKDETQRFLLSESTQDFAQKLKKKELTLELVSDFYGEFARANEPVVRFRKAWVRLLAAGVFFLISAVVSCFSFYGYEMILIYSVSLAFVLLAWALLNLYYLERIL